MTEAIKKAMTELVESGVLDVHIAKSGRTATVHHSRDTDAPFEVVEIDTHTCTCDTFATWLTCPHLMAVNKAIADARAIELHDSGEYGEFGTDPYAEY